MSEDEKDNEQGLGDEEVRMTRDAQFNRKKNNKGGSFESFNLSQEVYRAIKKKGYNMPTPIQRKAIPVIMEGFNIIAMARTGSGKTGAFVIPVVERLKTHSKIVGARSIILSPTREIAMQTAAYLKNIALNTDLTYVLIVGGNDFENQFERLILNPDIIIATPGRLWHCMQETGLQLNAVEVVVYDEADRLFEMGFAEQIKGITDRMPKSRQSLLFSATISSQVKDFTLSGIKDYRMIQVDKESKLSDDLKLHFFVVRSGEKPAALLYLMRELIEMPNPHQQTIIFGATRYHVEYIHELVSHAGFSSTFIFGAMDQRTREDRLYSFRTRKVNFLIVTDLAARGIDIPLLDNVIHYDFPPKLKLFIHRAGRTARNGQKGISYSLVTKEEVAYMHDLSIFVGRKYYEGPCKQVNSETGVEVELTNEDILGDPLKICFGKLPQSIMDEYCLQHGSLHSRFPAVLDPLQRSIANSLQKYHKNRDPASVSAISAVRNLLSPKIHPLLASKVDEAEEELDRFKESLKSFKPKQSVLEIGLIKTMDQERLDRFQSILNFQNEKYQEKVQRKEYAVDLRKAFDLEQRIHDAQVIKMKTLEIENDKKLKQSKLSEPQSLLGKMSKKRRMKIEKIRTDDTLSQKEKDSLISQLGAENSTEQSGTKRVKRSKVDDFRDKKNFLTVERSNEHEGGNGKLNQSSLWGEDERNFLEDVTLNLIPDDETGIKGKTVMRWDSTKKKHILVRVDRDRNIVKEKKNESGAKISNKDASKADDQKIYKKWMKRSHMKLQSVGEVEDPRAVQQARSSTEGRRMIKQFGKRHDLSKGEDARSNSHMLENKKKKLMDKTKSKGGIKKGSGNSIAQKFGDRSWKKIQEKSRPTRSMLIMKGQGGGGKGGDRKKGGMKGGGNGKGKFKPSRPRR